MNPRRLAPMALALAALAVPASAHAGVTVAGTGEPAFTRSAQNTHWIEWQSDASADAYRLRHRYYENNAQVSDPSVDVGTGASGTSWANWSGIAQLQEGGQYGLCVQGEMSFPNDSLFFPDGANSCSRGSAEGKRSHTTIDRTPPVVSPTLAAGAGATRANLIALDVGYQDALSPPFPGNFMCVAPGATPEAACGSATYGYTPQCSVPAAASKNTSFACQIDVSGIAADGPVQACVIAADSSIPDKPSSADQAGTADTANLSAKTCDSILLDRTAPSVAMSAGATTVGVGEPVSFGVQASDATSGLAPASATWTWGDGSAASAGDAPSHAFSAPGTYAVTVKVADAAGNEGQATRTITVRAPAGGGSGGGSSAGSQAGGGSKTSPSSPSGPSAQAIIKAAGGGGVQVRELGGLGVTAPKRVRLGGGRKSMLIGVTTAKAGRLSLKLAHGRRVRSKAAATTKAGAFARRLKLPRGMRPGRHTLTVSFTPRGASGAVTLKLRVTFVAARKAKSKTKAKGARSAGSTRRALSTAGLPAPSLPDGRLDGAPGKRVLRVSR